MGPPIMPGVVGPGGVLSMPQAPTSYPFSQSSADGNVCSLHHKQRSRTCLMDDGMGGYRCTLENQCKTKADPGHAPITARCSLHNKNRSRNCLTDDGCGGLRCVPESQ